MKELVIQKTKDYDMFDVNNRNRKLTKNEIVEESIDRWGWRPAQAMECVRQRNGRLLIKDGHHRLEIARKKGIPVWYVVAPEDGCSPADLSIGHKNWKISDYVADYVGKGNEEYKQLEAWCTANKMPYRLGSTLLSGYTSDGLTCDIKGGGFKVKNLALANDVMRVVSEAEKHVPWSRNSYFVSAVAQIIAHTSVKLDTLISRIRTQGHQRLSLQPDIATFVKMLQDLYNYRNHDICSFNIEIAKAFKIQRQQHLSNGRGVKNAEHKPDTK